MTVIEQKGDFEVTFNGHRTYMIVDNNGDCWGTFSSKKGALKFLNSVA